MDTKKERVDRELAQITARFTFLIKTVCEEALLRFQSQRNSIICSSYTSTQRFSSEKKKWEMKDTGKASRQEGCQSGKASIGEDEPEIGGDVHFQMSTSLLKSKVFTSLRGEVCCFMRRDPSKIYPKNKSLLCLH